MSPERTYARLITPPGRGGIAVIAMTGPAAGEILGAIFTPRKSHAQDLPDMLRLGNIVDGDGIVDEAVVCRRGDAYEINIHGGPLVAKRTLELLAGKGALVGVGEDENAGQDDASASAGLLQSAHPRWHNPTIGREMLTALPQALSALAVTALAQQWSAGLSQLADECQSSISQEGATDRRDWALELRNAAGCLQVFCKLLRPCEVVLAGAPNAGKSTLANALVGRQVSIVHDVAGTTRDWVRELAVLNGVPVWLTDTAGLWEQAQGIDAEAVRRARQCAQSADLVLLACDHEQFATPQWLEGKTVLRLATQCDLAAPPGAFDVQLSARTGEGLGELKGAILRAIGMNGLDPTAPMAFTDRQAKLLLNAANALQANDRLSAQDYLLSLLQGCHGQALYA